MEIRPTALFCNVFSQVPFLEYRPVCHLFGFTRVSFCQNFSVAFHPRNRIVTALMPSLLFRCFSLFRPHLRTLAQEKRSEVVFVLGLVGGVSVSIHYCREISEYFSPRSQWPLARKKISGKAICSRNQSALSRFGARLRILNLTARLC